VEEVNEISAELKDYPVSIACETLHAPRSSYYMAKSRTEPYSKRGPKTPVTDEELFAAVCSCIEETPFYGEGYKKVWARVRYGRWKLAVGKNRVLRLMRIHNLLSPFRQVKHLASRAHDGVITAACPNLMWGADSVQFWTEEEGNCWFFGVADHFNSECVGWTVVKTGDRWAAIESLREAVRNVFGTFENGAAEGVWLRHDHGSQYTARAFQSDIKYAGLVSTPAFVGEPQCNGVIERFFRTLREQCLWINRFNNIEEAKEIIGGFITAYNEKWILHRLGYRTPIEARLEHIAAKELTVA
jgi:putative transposase